MRTCIVPTSLVAFFLLSILQVDPCRGADATLWVANDGADTGTCGMRSAPCRSISQAIENASDGDTIEVGEGRYGDITGTGTFASGGDEHGQLLPSRIGCIVCITKAVHIFSVHGAAITLIQGVAGTRFGSTVLIGHDGVTFGAKDHGFTLTGGNSSGVSVVLNIESDFQSISIVAPIRIEGNIDIGDSTGFSYSGPELTDVGCFFCVFTGQVLFSDNEADNNGAGFAIDLGQYGGEPILLLNNVARNGGTGFGVLPGFASEAALSLLGAGNVSLLNNVATGNAVGFNAISPGDIRGNFASGNSQIGFLIVPGGGLFTGNSAIGNAGPGVIVQYSADGQSPDIAELGPNAIPRFSSFSDNDFFGNDRNRPLLQLSVVVPAGPNPIYNPGPSAHCGVLNVGALIGPLQGVPGPAITLKAPDNFWGSTKGPSAAGPGDAAGGACDQNNATTTTKPFEAAIL
jgi:hypothetical protein